MGKAAARSPRTRTASQGGRSKSRPGAPRKKAKVAEAAPSLVLEIPAHLKAWVITANMGLGHQRAAWPLRHIAEGGIITLGKDENTSPAEQKLWHRLRASYEFLSRTKSWPLIGNALFNLLDRIQNIPRFYPIRDMSNPSIQVNFLKGMIEKGLCRSVLEEVKAKPLPVISTFYAPTIAADMAGIERNYCVICDAEVNRAWAPEKPRESRIVYFVPCGRAVKRMKEYGIPDERLFVTGFPLPLELLGDRNLDVLRYDLGQRLRYLDPLERFWPLNGISVEHFLGAPATRFAKERVLSITFGVGGAGAQTDIAYTVAESLREKIAKDEVRYTILAGVRPEVREFVERMRKDLGCPQIRMAWGATLTEYFSEFTQAMKTTDILWTKPSELSFYCGLGIPIVIAPTIGSQEQYNRDWLLEIQAGMPQEDPKYTHQWLFDRLIAGRLADAAWAGFLKARKYGTYKIMEVLQTGTMKRESSATKR